MRDSRNGWKIKKRAVKQNENILVVFVQCGKKKKVEGEKRFELETDGVNGTINTSRTRLIYLRKENQNENAV